MGRDCNMGNHRMPIYFTPWNTQCSARSQPKWEWKKRKKRKENAITRTLNGGSVQHIAHNTARPGIISNFIQEWMCMHCFFELEMVFFSFSSSGGARYFWLDLWVSLVIAFKMPPHASLFPQQTERKKMKKTIGMSALIFIFGNPDQVTTTPSQLDIFSSFGPYLALCLFSLHSHNFSRRRDSIHYPTGNPPQKKYSQVKKKKYEVGNGGCLIFWPFLFLGFSGRRIWEKGCMCLSWEEPRRGMGDVDWDQKPQHRGFDFPRRRGGETTGNKAQHSPKNLPEKYGQFRKNEFVFFLRK